MPEGSSEVGVVAAKLVPHRRPRGSVGRPHLLDTLRGGGDRTLTLLSAPAGFGKTTLLSEWVDASGPALRFAWVSLDAGDREPVRLWTHVITALARAVGPAFGARSLAALRANSTRVVESVLPVLLDELSDAPGDLVLVLDDYHLVENAAIDDQVQFVLAYRPSGVQLVVSTRSDPSLGIARLRASGELVELRADTLRFDAGELAEFFEGVGIGDLTETNLLRIGERTGGWPAPVRLAALLLPDHDRDTFIESFTGESRTVVDYLTGDVLDLLKPETREFLLQVSVLRRMNGPLCDAVVDGSGSGELLAAMERGNLFLSTDADGTWYHQHHLFREALHLELTRTSADLVPRLHARAARWLADSGDLETATEHAIAARDVAMASALVAGQLQLLVSTGRAGTIRGWLSALTWPEAIDDAELAFVRATLAALVSRYDDATAYLEVARRGPADRTDPAGLPLGFRVDFLHGLVGVNQVGAAHDAARRASRDAPSSSWEGVALAGVGQAEYLLGRAADAASTLRRAVEKIPDTNPVLLAAAVGSLGLAEAGLDDGVSRAAPMVEEMLAVLASIGAEDTAVAAVLHLAIGEARRADGDLRAADRSFETALDLLQGPPSGTWLALGHLLRAQTQVGLGDLTSAASSLTAAEEYLARIPDPGGLWDRSARLRALVRSPVKVTASYGEQLTERELAVLHLAATGLEQRKIAEQLYISYNTVKSHLKTSYRKLGVSSRAEAVERLVALEAEALTAESTEPSPG